MSAIDLHRSLIDDTTMVKEDDYNLKVDYDRDQMMVPFQCDVFQFLNIYQRFPVVVNHTDELLVLCIRRVILDRMRAREWSTVHSNLS